MKNVPLFFSHALRQIETAAASLSLMQRAGKTSAQWYWKHYPNAQNIYVLAGSGNNGGDALLTAKQLHLAGKNVFCGLARQQLSPMRSRPYPNGWLAVDKSKTTPLYTPI